MRVTELLIILFSGKPIIQIVTVFPLSPFIVTRAPEGSIRLEELKVMLSAGGVDGEDLVRLVHTGGVDGEASGSIRPSVPGEGTMLVV